MKYLFFCYKESDGLGKKNLGKVFTNTKIRTVKNCIENCFQVNSSEPNGTSAQM